MLSWDLNSQVLTTIALCPPPISRYPLKWFIQYSRGYGLENNRQSLTSMVIGSNPSHAILKAFVSKRSPKGNEYYFKILFDESVNVLVG